MAIDSELVRRKMRLILEDLDRLEPIAALDLGAYLADERNELVVERLLERMIGRMIDVNYHLAVRQTGLPPSDYHASFAKLAEMGILSPEDALRLAHTAGLRNRLAHEYDGIDARKVHAAARNALVEVPDYLRAIEALLSRA